MRDMLTDPPWRPEDLGRPLPDSIHAISVAMPRWEDVCGYEEKKPEVIEKLQTGYPRFLVHPLVRELAGQLGAGPHCLPLPSAGVAADCAAFVKQSSGEAAEAGSKSGVHYVRTSAKGEPALKAYWQHTGKVICSRHAETLLGRRTAEKEDPALRPSLRRTLADFYDCAEDDILLQPAGMTAVHAALQAANARSPGKPSVQMGFPYVDTLKLQEKFGPGGILLHNLATLEADLAALIQKQPLAAAFCEIPGNPLLGSADLRRISPLLRKHGIPLVVDEVVATPFNVDLRQFADVIATSLTKFIAGTGDVMGGALIFNPRSPYYQQLKQEARARHEELLWHEDVAILERNARTFPERMKQHNHAGLLLAGRLRAHPAVERVWYPKWDCAEAYEALRRPGGGWGALLSFVPRHAANTSPAVYDRLQLCKGPSLGTVFSLACPFTLLAHYTELDWAESCGVSRWLIRLSVGLEDPEILWRKLDDALSGKE